jgi:hypothetical protein
MGSLSVFCEVVETTQKRKESPLPMRRRKRDLPARVNGSLRLEFKSEGLTSFAGLECIARHLRLLGLNDRLRTVFRGLPVTGDYSIVAMVRLILALLLVGARRLRHVRFVSRDPLVRRFAGLRVLPDERTVSRWLGRFDRRSLGALAQLNRELVFDAVRRLKLKSLTIDLDGTVVSTGMQVEWAQRGYNPHHRKVPSYYPLVAHLAETGQVLGMKNRPGNVHDGKHAEHFVRDLVRKMRGALGKRVALRFRMDGAFFQRPMLEALRAQRVDFAVKVPMHRWLDLKPRIQMRTKWVRINDTVSAFDMVLPVRQWGLELRVVCYRKRVFHPTAKNFQLDLFSPDDGTYEYSAVATSLDLSLKNLWLFMAGRGAQEKTFAELKGGFAFDTVPTRRYAANSAWQWLSVLAHNLHRDFQLSWRSHRRARNGKRTYLYTCESVQTSRFEWLNVAGRVLRLADGLTLRLAKCPEVEERFRRWLPAA